MKKLMITCPECKHEFSPDQSLKHQLDHLMQEERSSMAANFAEKENAVKQREKELNKKETSIELIVTEKLNAEKAKMKTDLEKKLRSDSKND